MTHSKQFLIETATLAGLIDSDRIEEMVRELAALRERRGRLFVIGLGGSAANASHMVNDMRRLCGIEAYAPTDNVAEITAAANDDGWDGIFAGWLRGSNASINDAIFVLSVGGGAWEQDARGFVYNKVSFPIVTALREAKRSGMKVFGIVGREGGETAKHGDHVLIIPTVKSERVTPHCEAFQAVIWHAIVSHPDLQRKPTKW